MARGGTRRAAAANGGAAYNVGGRKPVVARARDKTRRSGARLLEDPANDERQLAAQLKRLGLYAANTLGDGSCLFRSLSDQLHGSPNYHLLIRSEVCNFLLAHSGEFIAFIDDSNHSSPDAAFAAHVAEMRHSATYGTQLEIVAFARMMKRRVKVIQAELVYVIGHEDESPAAKAKRAQRRDSKGKAREEEEELPDLYIVYHNWEHYSSARNIQGPHVGLPCIIEQKQPMPGASKDADIDDTPIASQEESIILNSLRFPHRHTVIEIRKQIHDRGGDWEQVLEDMVEHEVDETESEDFNPSPQLNGDVKLPPSDGTEKPPPRSSASHAARSASASSAKPSPSFTASDTRSTSPSSTATSSTHTIASASTASTRLSDTHEPPRPSTKIIIRRRQPSRSPSLSAPHPTTATLLGSSKVRSRASSPDHPDIAAAESPRQRFRISREDLYDDTSSSVGGNDDGSSVISVSSDGSTNHAQSERPRFGTPSSTNDGNSPSPEATTHASAASKNEVQPPAPLKAKRGRPRKDQSLAAHRLRNEVVPGKPPTRRQRKQMLKSGTTPASATGKEENVGLQREFKELYV